MFYSHFQLAKYEAEFSNISRITHHIHIVVTVKIGSPGIKRISRKQFQNDSNEVAGTRAADWLMMLVIDDQDAPRKLCQVAIALH